MSRAKEILKNLSQLDEGSYYTVKEGMSVKEIAARWKKWEKGYDPSNGYYHGYWPVKELLLYSEVRTRSSVEYNRLGASGWDDLKKEMQKIDWDSKKPLVLTVYRDGRSPVVSEGNHRLAIAGELKIKKVPVIFVFY